MELTVLERMTLLQILPSQGDFRTLRILGELQRDLALTEEEIKNTKFRKEPGPSGTEVFKWDDTTYKADIKIGPVAEELIKQQMVKRDKEQTMEMSQMWIYERFVKPETEAAEEKVKPIRRSAAK